MTKYECRCAANSPCRCVIECSPGIAPFRCCLTGASSCNWRRVGDQNPELPKWCKVGAWVWFSGAKDIGYEPGYLKITDVGYNGSENVIDCGKKINFPLSVVKQARLRPWTYKEAPETLKVISKCEPEQMICLFLASRNKHSVQYTTLPAWYIDVKILMDKYLQLDGSPCGVLEHYENGEWVE